MPVLTPKQNSPTPWGNAQHVEPVAEGLLWVSTSSHGGMFCSQQRWKRIITLFPKMHPWAGERWLEEDCDWAYAVMAFPEHFTADQCANALSIQQHFHPDVIAPFLASADAKPFLAKVEASKRARDGQWKVGVTSGGGGDPWISVHLTQQGTGATKVAAFQEWPRQEFYTDAELDAAAYKPQQPAAV